MSGKTLSGYAKKRWAFLFTGLKLAISISLSFFLMSAIAVGAPQDDGEKHPYGVHFILLVDDSGDMRGYKDQIVRDLPEFLFKGITSFDGSGQSLPSFNPSADRLSLVFFGI